MQNKTELNPLELFNYKEKNCHYFEALFSSFWDSDNIIQKRYKYIKKEKEADSKIYKNIDLKLLEESHKTLLNLKLKSDYLRYLMIEYTLCQPRNINDLVDNYYSVVFPYFLFLLNESNEELYYLVLDNINFSLNFYEKNILKNSFEIDEVKDINLNLNYIEIQIVNSKDNLHFIPYNIHDLELLQILIYFMATIKKKKDNYRKELKKVNEINQNLNIKKIQTIEEKEINSNLFINKFDISKLKILSNDSFVPKGIIFTTYVSLEYNKNTQDRFFLLGRRYIYLFKSDSLKELLSIIPLTPGFTIFELEDIYQRMRIRAGNKEYNFFIYKTQIYNEFRDNLMDILEGNKEDIFNKKDIFKCSQNLYNDKIMGGIFENTPIYEKNQNDIKNLKNQIEELKKIKKEIEKECFINESINQLIQNSKKEE